MSDCVDLHQCENKAGNGRLRKFIASPGLHACLIETAPSTNCSVNTSDANHLPLCAKFGKGHFHT